MNYEDESTRKCNVHKQITITSQENEWLKKRFINLSKLVRSYIRDAMSEEGGSHGS